MIYLLDTNVLNDVLRGKEPVKSRFMRHRGHVHFILSPVVNFEMRRYLLLKGDASVVGVRQGSGVAGSMRKAEGGEM